MYKLKSIKKITQSIACAIAAALEVEVTIIDRDCERVAGTGPYLKEIGTKIAKNCLYTKIMETGEANFINNKINNNVCQQCDKYLTCKEKSTMGYPITIKDKTIGVIGLLAFDENQYNKINLKKDNLLTFLKEMSGLLESQLVVNETLRKLKIGKTELDTIIDSINEGMILIDNINRITHINEKAEDILNLSKVDILGKKYKDVINGLNIYCNDIKSSYSNNWKVKGKKINIHYTITPIIIDNKERSLIISFKKIDDIVSLAHNIVYKPENITFASIIGESDVFKIAKEKTQKVARSNCNSTIMLQGSSGTGKELFARAIHNVSDRRNKPFITINCSAIPETLLESELFGYEQGAFTGAKKLGKKGKFELADGGTIFLDEIGDLPLKLQPKLLRVVQQKAIEKIGSNQIIKVDVRIISATHKDLKRLIEVNKFREDLYYRLNVIPINIPDLKDRGDIVLYAEYFLDKYSRLMGFKKKKLSPAVKNILEAHCWPGNVRELENVIEYSVNFSCGDIIRKENLPEYIHKESFAKKHIMFNGTLDEQVRKYESYVIQKHLQKYGYSTTSKKEIAKKLGISLTTLYRKLEN